VRVVRDIALGVRPNPPRRWSVGLIKFSAGLLLLLIMVALCNRVGHYIFAL